MTSRRSFFRSFIAALVAAPIVCRMAEALPVMAEKAKEVVTAINPEWEKAAYEETFIYYDPNPMRLNLNAKGEWEQVFPSWKF